MAKPFQPKSTPFRTEEINLILAALNEPYDIGAMLPDYEKSNQSKEDAFWNIINAFLAKDRKPHHDSEECRSGAAAERNVV